MPEKQIYPEFHPFKSLELLKRLGHLVFDQIHYDHPFDAELYDQDWPETHDGIES